MDAFVTLDDGTAVWTTSSGSGPPALFLNGGPGMADYLGPVARLLGEDLRAHRYEQQGCGRTQSEGPFSLATFVSDIEARRSQWGYRQWYVMGHSWCVDLALAYALHYRASVIGLIGLAGGRVHNDRSWKRHYEENKHRETLPPAASEPNLAVNRSLNDDWKLFCQRPTLLRDLAALTIPTLFVYGEDDIRPSWPTEQISELMPAAEFRRIPGADHHLWQHKPGELKRAIADFLTSTSATKD
ncbi:MAG: alpha/beta fold hydrolase [Pseudomonadota bacterium]